jgi:hypothetical protein
MLILVEESNQDLYHSNQELFDDKLGEPAKLHIFDGPLFNPGITAAAIENPGMAY